MEMEKLKRLTNVMDRKDLLALKCMNSKGLSIVFLGPSYVMDEGWKTVG